MKLWCVFMSAGIDFSFNRGDMKLITIFVFVRNIQYALELYRNLEEKIYGKELHFRKLSAKEKNTILSYLDRIMEERKISVVFIEIDVKSGLTWIKRLKLEEFLATLIKNLNVVNVYCATDIDKKNYCLAKRLSEKAPKANFYSSNNHILVQLADVFGGWFRRRGLRAEKNIDC